MNSLGFCTSETVLISASFLKHNLPNIESWLTVFSFSTLDMSSLGLLASIVSNKKAATYLIEDSLYVRNSFSVATFRSLSLSFDSLIMMCPGVDLFEFILFGVHLVL